ncbi:hypothetical protein [Burkholderia plantarii]|uniref:hypothetical protein n=1 Tax=Burkholderia plantarii TaxID=41899 RepID=UPI0018DC4E60|nr:hypothetical protein [Burkholderia plantarii]MBI0331325.1 hypothetical protein [Burkholderia plantarii]
MQAAAHQEDPRAQPASPNPADDRDESVDPFAQTRRASMPAQQGPRGENRRSRLQSHLDNCHRRFAPAFRAGVSRRRFAPAFRAGVSRRRFAPAFRAGVSRRRFAPAFRAGVSRRRFAPAFLLSTRKFEASFNREID